MKAEIINVFKDAWPTMAIVSSIIIIMRVTYLFKSERKSFSLHEEFLNILFFVYLILLFRLVSGQDVACGGINLTPFTEITRYKYGTLEFNKQVFGNILLFIPLGYFISRYCKLKGLLSITIISLLCSLSIETVQYYIGRCADIDDVILNTVGGIIGFLIYVGIKAIKNHLPRFLRKNWFYSLITLIIIVIIILCVIGVI